jgi:hypothetical protein
MFGTYPINISTSASGAVANGNSSAPTLSGDNRKTRYAAFQSDGSNLVAGDTNRATDIFMWFRPKGREGLTLPKGSGSLQRMSIPNPGINCSSGQPYSLPGACEANGASRNPSLDGSNQKLAHCVAFESDASNMAAGDADKIADIFVRDFQANKTFLVSRGITAPATDPSIAGDCSKVAYVANGKVLVQGVKAGAAKVLGSGDNPDYALDGRAVAWEQGSKVAFVRDGKKSVVGPGANPTVTDAERLHNMTTPNWGVSFDTPAKLSSKDKNPGIDLYLRVYGPKGGPKRTDLITFAQPKVDFAPKGDNYNAGITAYGTNRGILDYVHVDARATDMYYWNQHTGNADDVAHAATRPDGTPGITQAVLSARANFIAFTSAFAGDQSLPWSGALGNDHGTKLPGGIQLPRTLDQLFSPYTNVYFKMLVDGEQI